MLEPLLPVPKRPGRPSSWSRRQLIDGIRWRVRVGAPWRDVPPQYGSWSAGGMPVPPVATRRHLETGADRLRRPTRPNRRLGHRAGHSRRRATDLVRDQVRHHGSD
ncbi:transposase [Micromonospora sp. KC207]|uniref:transposase n=1 Tax=Micromonospora sp. KC207 TaxID=2530377 RepID=UPI00352E27B0